MLNIIFSPFPALKTERLTLRPLSVNDDKQIFALRADPKVNEYLVRAPCNSIEDARKFIEKITETVVQNKGIYWAITQADDDQLIGTICLFQFSNENDQAEIGYELLPAFQGKGIMQEALTEVISYAFETIEAKTIEAFLHINNQNSINLLEKLSFINSEEIDETNPELIGYRLKSSKS